MKRIIIGALLLASTAQLSAQHEYLTLRAKNGDETSVKVTNQTVLKFENGNLKATTNGATTEFALSNLKAFFFAAQPTSIAESVANKSFVKLTASGIVVSAPAQTKVAVATIDGRNLLTFEKLTDGAETRSLRLAKGVYVVRIGETSQTVLVP